MQGEGVGRQAGGRAGGQAGMQQDMQRHPTQHCRSTNAVHSSTHLLSHCQEEELQVLRLGVNDGGCGASDTASPAAAIAARRSRHRGLHGRRSGADRGCCGVPVLRVVGG